MHAEIPRQRRIFFLHFFIHRVCHITIRSVPGRPCTQLRDVNRFRKIHLEKRALAEAEWDRILGILIRLWTMGPCKCSYCPGCVVHRRLVARERAGRLKFDRDLAAMPGRKVLLDLNASAMAVHVAETADVHQDVETELLARAETSKHLVVPSATAQAGVDDFPSPGLAGSFDCASHLPIRMRTMLVQQSGR